MQISVHEKHWGQYAVRLQTLDGESLSSFRHRVGLANGYVCYPWITDDRRHFDPDLCGNESEARQLAVAHGVSQEELHKLSLRALTNIIAPEWSLRKRPAWLLKSRYDRTDAPNGAMYCPMCLAADRMPYFRLRWRVGLLNECSIHSIALHDKCPECGAGVWPQVAGHRIALLHHELSLESCPHCHALLSSASATPCDPKPVAAIERLLDEPLWQLSPGKLVPSIEVVAAIDAISHLFMRRRSRQQLAQAASQWSELAESLQSVRWNLHTADLPLALRSKLVAATLPLLDKWPDRFLEFAQENSLTRFHFSGCEQLHPPWMESVIEANLRKQLRGITDDQVIATVDALRAANIRVTRPLVNRMLQGGGQSTSVKTLLKLRFEASEGELRSLLKGLIGQCEHMRRRVPASTARDHVVICVAVLARMTLGHAADLPVIELEKLIPALAAAAPRSRKKFSEFLVSRWSDYQLHIRRLRPDGTANGQLYAASRGSGKAEGRGQTTAQIKLRRAMQGFDDRLARQVRVFWSAPARERGSTTRKETSH